TERECRHLPNLELLIAQQARERFHGLLQPDASDCQRRSTPHSRFRIAKEANEIGRPWWRENGWLGARGWLQDRGRRRIGIAQQPLIFQSKHPSELLLPTDDSGSDRRGRSRKSRRRGRRRRGTRRTQRNNCEKKRHERMGSSCEKRERQRHRSCR